MYNTVFKIGTQSFEWSDLDQSGKYVVYNGNILNIARYLESGRSFIQNEKFNKILRDGVGRDITRAVLRKAEYDDMMKCMMERFFVGVMEITTAGCMFTSASSHYANILIV
jgi:hypothetical protein